MCMFFENQHMKKLFIVLLTISFFSLTAASAGSKVSSSRVASLVSEFTQADGVNIVQVGRLGTGVLKKLIADSVDRNDPEELAMLEIIRGIKKFTVIDYGSCEDSVKERFDRKLAKALPKDDILMDVKDNGESMRIYGIVSENGDSLKDFVMHAPGSSTLICLFGTISLDGVSKFIEN